MRHALTAVLERNTTFTADFVTEPYEAGWAAEARWFVRTLALEGDAPSLRLTAQISPDGLHWCDDDGSTEQIATEPGMVSMRVREFGHWLRLRATLTGGDPKAKVLVYLALKS
ncbi:hypothetical protein E1267_12790 [Nonomuraea longispora]|uniref:Uncharacterized protein n=1 Tax=Nonomuraea longispora TaxID=1848320 RepID=A0A4R4NJD5_9ACTN|nr:hypothetical protein [Nonomuraea longispora]TDC07587.1 hypothetical protein E1267_12790 [Nonomuraea longispora]